MLTISAQLLSSQERHSLQLRTSLVTALATLLGLHSAIQLYDPSFMTLILGFCSSCFLFQAFHLFKKESSVQLPPDEYSSKEFLDVEFHETERNPSPFLIRFRSIAFLLTILSTITFIVLSRLYSFHQVVSVKWWQGVAIAVVIQSGRWMSICFLVQDQVDASDCSSYSNITTLLQLHAPSALQLWCISFVRPRNRQ